MTLGHTFDGPEDAPILVLPCSLGTSTELWEPDLFTGRYRLLRYDQRGHGDSPVPRGPYTMDDLGADALGLLDALGLGQVSWCGLSLGGMVGMWLAARAPQRLVSLVLACTSAHVPAPEAYAKRAAVVRDGGIEPIADDVIARWFTQLTPADTQARFRSILVSTPSEGYAGCCEALEKWDFRDELSAVSVPTLVIAGERDEATPRGDSELLAERIPRASLVVLDGAAHLANVERPHEFAATVLEAA